MWKVIRVPSFTKEARHLNWKTIFFSKTKEKLLPCKVRNEMSAFPIYISKAQNYNQTHSSLCSAQLLINVLTLVSFYSAYITNFVRITGYGPRILFQAITVRQECYRIKITSFSVYYLGSRSLVDRYQSQSFYALHEDWEQWYSGLRPIWSQFTIQQPISSQ